MSDLSFGSSTEVKKRQLPGSVAQALTITKYELLNYFRSRRFFVLLIIGVAISGHDNDPHSHLTSLKVKWANRLLKP